MSIHDANEFIMDNKSLRSKSLDLSASMFVHKTVGDFDPRVKYKIKKSPIGKGSFSTVFYATDSANNEYAIKRIELSKLDPSRHDKFMLELDISAKIEHPNIVKCFEVFKTSTYWYIVNEYCNYGTFADLSKAIFKLEPKKKEELCNHYFKQLRDALKYLHSNNIIHRDLKPMNILMTKSNTSPTTKEVVVKLADFGFARYFENKPQNVSGYEDMVSTICGSPIYMAPELLIDMKYNTKADLWSFGVIMYELLYGINPYNYPKTISDLRKVIIEQKIIFNEIYSSSCISLMKKLLQVDPERRISWNNFFAHKWFDRDFEMDDSDSDSDTDIEHDYDTSRDSDFDCMFKFDEKDSEKHLPKTKILDSTAHPTKSLMENCIENYVDSTIYKDREKIPPLPKSATKAIDIPLPSKGGPSKNGQSKDKKINTYEETIFGSTVRILSDSIGYLFSQAKSY